ncbi:hypothetical protein [Clostridium tetani]|nr:hypothetical protein [Clostridium tetani]
MAEDTGALAINQYDIKLIINTWRLEKIDKILRAQRQSKIYYL